MIKWFKKLFYKNEVYVTCAETRCSYNKNFYCQLRGIYLNSNRQCKDYDFE